MLLLALYASILLVLIAGDALLFLLAWEAMSIFCYLLMVSVPTSENGPFRSGYLLLAIGEAGTVAAALGFLLLACRRGLTAIRRAQIGCIGARRGRPWAVFLLSFFGFGVKAGWCR